MLKIKLSVSDEAFAEIQELLESAGFEIDDDAEFILSQRNRFSGHMAVVDERGERLHIKTEDIIFIESFGHSLEIHTAEGIFKSNDALYQVLASLDPNQFLRVSNSVIIAKGKIKHIKPSISMKFILTMSNGSLVDVTRSYYQSFKKAIGI